MDRYMLTAEGRARFRRMKTSADMAGTESYKILDYLYEIGAGSIEEIGSYTGLPRESVVSQLLALLNHDFVEETD